MTHESGSTSRDVLAGTLAGAANVISGHPFDTVKVIMQGNPRDHKNAISAARHVVSTSGTLGLYRGMTSPLIGGALETAVNYGVYHRVRRRILETDSGEPLMGWPAQVVASGGTAGVALSFVIGPTELIKCKMQSGSHTSILKCIKDVYRTEGVRGFGRGFGATVCREVPGNIVFFATYEGLQAWTATWLGVGREELVAPVCGGIAGMSLWAAIFPLDVAKTRIQVASPGSADDVGVVGQLRRVFGTYGVRGLYSGFRPTMARAFVANAVQWLMWEYSSRKLREGAA